MIANQKLEGPSGGGGPSKNGKKLLDRALDALLAEGFAEAVARRYVSWMWEYILFHNKRHPQEMGVPEVRAFLLDVRFSEQSGQRVEATAAIRFLYGSGLRIKECCRLRVKDVDPERLQLAVRNGKGDQDQATVLPRRLVDRLRRV